jgi:cytochrome d ubiquinol oxidase subunit II
MIDLFTLPNVLAGLIVVALNGYVLLGGADFGGGVWDLLASGSRRDSQRALIAEAIGPIWEANHVWLIIVIVLLFTCFPPAFAALSITLHIPLTLMLIGIVLRGSAFTFRAHHGEDSAMPLYWGHIFAIASAVTPVFLGICLGAVASGAVPRTNRADFYGGFIAPWLTPFCLAVGALTLTLFALPLHVVTGLAALGAIGALWVRRYRVARLAAAAQVSLILWGWALGQYPYLVPTTVTIAEAAAPPLTLTLVLWALAGGALVLFPSLAYLFRVFKGQPDREDRA